MNKPVHISKVVAKIMEDLELRRERILEELRRKFPEGERSSFIDGFLEGVDSKEDPLDK